MNAFSIALALVLGSTGTYNAATESPQLSAEQSSTLEAIRSSALQYSNDLPNFICTQLTHRDVKGMGSFGLHLSGISSGGAGMNVSPMNGSGPDSNDSIEERLTYIGGKENYEVVKFNGKNVAGLTHMQFQGTISGGEFGSSLHAIFDPQSHTVFTWDRQENRHGRRVDVLRFQVPKESGITLVHKETGVEIVVAYSGQLFVDTNTLEVLRINSTLAIPPSFPILMSTSEIEYKPVMIAGKRYNLPARSEVRMRDRTHLYVNSIDFRDYHKFGVESTIRYGDDAPQ